MAYTDSLHVHHLMYIKNIGGRTNLQYYINNYAHIVAISHMCVSCYYVGMYMYCTIALYIEAPRQESELLLK